MIDFDLFIFEYYYFCLNWPGYKDQNPKSRQNPSQLIMGIHFIPFVAKPPKRTFQKINEMQLEGRENNKKWMIKPNSHLRPPPRSPKHTLPYWGEKMSLCGRILGGFARTCSSCRGCTAFGDRESLTFDESGPDNSFQLE